MVVLVRWVSEGPRKGFGFRLFRGWIADPVLRTKQSHLEGMMNLGYNVISKVVLMSYRLFEIPLNG